MSSVLSCKIVGLGAWGAHFENAAALTDLFMGGSLPEAGKGPKPAVIPANERRRAPLTVRLGVESSWQACQQADVSPQDLKSVFVSGLGDTELTDYMCRVLASQAKQLSPTKFHNSVHNAPAGYWTISTGATGAANSVAGYQNSLPIALLEAMVQCQIEKTPILITLYDAPVAPSLKSILKNAQAFAASFIIFPEDSPKPGTSLKAEVISKPAVWPELATQCEYLQNLYADNPAAKALCILEGLLADQQRDANLCLPLSSATSISLQFT